MHLFDLSAVVPMVNLIQVFRRHYPKGPGVSKSVVLDFDVVQPFAVGERLIGPDLEFEHMLVILGRAVGWAAGGGWVLLPPLQHNTHGLLWFWFRCDLSRREEAVN